MPDSNDELIETTPTLGRDALLAALVALLADAREADAERVARRKTEVLLADVGLKSSQIGAILGKKPDTVRVAIARARKATPATSTEK